MKKERTSTYNPEADSNWIEKNRDHKRYLSYRSSARTFVRNHATNEDIEELENLIKIRKEENDMKELLEKELAYLKNEDWFNEESLLDWYHEPETNTLRYVESGMAYDGDDKEAAEVFQTLGTEITSEK